MPFQKVETKVDFPALEREVLAYWERSGAFEALRRKNAGKPKWSFLDGPITANNPMGVHHAWGRTYKDVFQRFFAATGHDLRYQNGFDCQGLWVEVEVEKEHGFTDKRQIEEYGIGKFVNECKARAEKFAAIQTQQSIRLGYWMDWSNSYYTMSDGNNYAIWAFLKKCYEKGLIYKGFDVMAWCPRCGTGISQMEMNEGYKTTEHLSVFLAFPIRERPGENLLVWTTTPWTLSSNVAAAVKPDMRYVKVRQGDKTYYLGKANFHNARKQPAEDAESLKAPNLMAIQAMFKNHGSFEVVGELDGLELVGLTYDGPFDNLDGAAEARPVHRVIAWDMVTESEGTGIVHIAPGCGSEDYHLGKELGLPQIAPLLENGRFRREFGFLAERRFDEVADAVIDDLKARQILFAKERYFHRYPHCWRCKTELVYRLVDEWFINMNWRDKIMDSTRQARWIPEWGLERELDWLRNMGDWMISKKRYWGLALPIWECHACGHFEVIGGREELKARSVRGWEKFDGHSPHRPWVDEVRIRCAQCGDENVTRVKDVGNPWLDASIVPFSTMGHFEDRAYWEQWFPADFIVECLPGQFRNWFYALLAISTMMVEKSPFKTLLGHGLVMDDNMEAMHKSKGNALEFNKAAEEIGVDVMRWMYCAHAPERNLGFGPMHADETRKRVLIPLWNVYAFFSNYAQLDGFDPAAERPPVKDRPDVDRWILSDLQLLIQAARKEFADFDTLSVCQQAETFIENLSTWYVRRSRRRFWKSEWSLDKRSAYHTLHEVLTTLNGLLAPIIPFVAEHMYQNLVVGASADGTSGSPLGPSTGSGTDVGGSDSLLPASVHLCDYPLADEALIDHALTDRMTALLRIVSLARSARTVSKLKVRQPLASIMVVPATPTEREAVEQFEAHVLDELNVKTLTIMESAAELRTVAVKLNKKLAGPKYGKQLGAVTAALEALNPNFVLTSVEAGRSVAVSVSGEALDLEPGEITVEKSYGDAWAAAEDRGTVVLLDKRVTPELRLEGLARDVVRNVQNLRKDSGLNIEDRIELSLVTADAELKKAIEAFKDYIARETLALTIQSKPIDSPHRCEVEIDGKSLAIGLVKRS